MDEAIRALLEAHVQHELSRFRARRLRQTLREEVSMLFAWLQRSPLRELLTPAQVTALIARQVVESPLPRAIAETAAAMSRRVLESKSNSSTALADICPRASFDAAVARLGGLEDARREFIHQLVTSTVYTQQISDALFTGIKDYLLTENILAQKIPGLASLIKLGKFAVNKTMHPLEAAVEKTVKAYIESNLGSTIRRSEQSINAYFDQDRISDLGHKVWSGVANRPIADYSGLLGAEDLDDLVAIGLGFWLHFRKTAYFKAIYTDLVQAFFEQHGDRPVAALLADYGVTEKIAVSELMQLLGPGIAQALADGYLEQRIRQQLESFYAAPGTATLIAGLALSGSGAKTVPPSRPASRKAAPSARPKAKRKPA